MQERIGRYEIRREIGRGGMATVYLALDPRFRRQVAIKVLPRQFTHDPRYLARFEQEAQTVAALEHQAIVPVYDFGEHEDAPYLVMRYMPGGSLQDRMKGEPLPLGLIADTLERLAPALDKAHELNIIHRDLKPANILFDDEGNPYLGDFGIARLAEASRTLTLVGTPAYMSPEQVQGDLELDGRSDIYALGVILYDLLTGRQPYEGDTPAKQMMAHVLDPVPDALAANPDLPPAAQEIIEKSMAKDREDRYASARELAAAVSKLAADASAPAAVEEAKEEPIVDDQQPQEEPEPAADEEVMESLPDEEVVEPLPEEPQEEPIDYLEGAGDEGDEEARDVDDSLAPFPLPVDEPVEEGGLPRWLLWAGGLVLAAIALYLGGTIVWSLVSGGQTGGSYEKGDYLDRAFSGEFGGSKVTILSVADEKARFNIAVAEFEEATGIDVQYAGVENNDVVFQRIMEEGVTSDIVDFPVNYLATEMAATGKFIDITTFLPQKLLADRYGPSWLKMAEMPGPDGGIIMAGVWHRFNGKSYVWYPREEFEARGYAVPNSWDELSDLKHQIVDDGGTPWCVGIESDWRTGWPATDWTEDLLLRTTTPDFYDGWAAGHLPFTSDEVRSAIERWSDFWFDPAFTFGGREYIASTSFRDAPQLMFEDPPQCWLHRQGSFIVYDFPEFTQYGHDYGVFYLPPIDQSLGRPMLISGNMMSMLNDREEVRAVMEFFTLPESTLPWMSDGAAFSPHNGATPDMYGSDRARDLAIINEEATSFHYDASDMMPADVGLGSFLQGMTTYVLGEQDLDTILPWIDSTWPR